VAIATDGTLYVADTGNHRLCRVKDGSASTLAGGTQGRTDGRGAAARFAFPGALALAADGAIWVADYGNAVARRVQPDGRVTTAAPPAAIAAALGDLSTPRAGTHIWASPEGRGSAEETRYELGRRSPGAGQGPIVLFGDLDHSVILEHVSNRPPLLIAGVRYSGPTVYRSRDGVGQRAQFGLPAAVALSRDGTGYIADFEASVVRRLRLPPWLIHGEEPPARMQRGFGRDSGGRRD
jgi:hypothetical protein